MEPYCSGTIPLSNLMLRIAILSVLFLLPLTNPIIELLLPSFTMRESFQGLLLATSAYIGFIGFCENTLQFLAPVEYIAFVNAVDNAIMQVQMIFFTK